MAEACFQLKEPMAEQAPGLINTTRSLLVMLLKWQFQPEARSPEAALSLRDGRYALDKMLRRSPVLRFMLGRILESVYTGACDSVAHDIGGMSSRLPEHCPYALQDIISPFFFPKP